MYYSHYEGEKDFITKHSITLGAEKRRGSQPVALKNVTGHVAWGTLKLPFDGVRRVRERWSSDAAVPWIESYWEVLLTESEDEESNIWLDMEGNGVGPAVVLDDNGFPFLVFDWRHPYGCHSSWSGYYLGKRLVEGKEWRLTDDERDRLGIGRTFRSVEKHVKEGSPGVYEEDEGEEDSDSEVVDSGESSGEDEDDTGGEGADVGVKRKATDDGTGANKRRRA